jgi:hypothetical protein
MPASSGRLEPASEEEDKETPLASNERPRQFNLGLNFFNMERVTGIEPAL